MRTWPTPEVYSRERPLSRLAGEGGARKRGRRRDRAGRGRSPIGREPTPGLTGPHERRSQDRADLLDDGAHGRLGRGGAYAAAKAGIIGLTRALAKELAPRRIAVNAVAPGLILGTPFHEQFTASEAQEATIARLPVGRAGWPADVASLVTYLAVEATDFLTGEVFNLSGGQELT